jgi:hypothetical protein
MFINVYSLCKEFGWTIQQAMKAPAWFITRFNKFTEVKSQFEREKTEQLKHSRASKGFR